MLVVVLAVAPHEVEQLGARVDAAGMGGKLDEQVELLRGELDDAAFELDAPLVESDRESFHRNAAVRYRVGALCHRRDTAQDGFHACEKLANTKRLREVVVRSHLEPDHAVRLRGFGGEHENRGVVRPRAHAPADFNSIGSRQHQIENNQIIASGKRLRQPFRAVMGQGDLKALLRKMKFHEIRNVSVVLDNQNTPRIAPVHSRHAPFIERNDHDFVTKSRGGGYGVGKRSMVDLPASALGVRLG